MSAITPDNARKTADERLESLGDLSQDEMHQLIGYLAATAGDLAYARAVDRLCQSRARLEKRQGSAGNAEAGEAR